MSAGYYIYIYTVLLSLLVQMLRDMFGFKPPLTKKQFFTVNAFAERKVMMCVDVMRLVQEHCRYVGSSKLTSRKVSVPVASVRHHKVCIVSAYLPWISVVFVANAENYMYIYVNTYTSIYTSNYI